MPKRARARRSGTPASDLNNTRQTYPNGYASWRQSIIAVAGIILADDAVPVRDRTRAAAIRHRASYGLPIPGIHVIWLFCAYGKRRRAVQALARRYGVTG